MIIVRSGNIHGRAKDFHVAKRNQRNVTLCNTQLLPSEIEEMHIADFVESKWIKLCTQCLKRYLIQARLIMEAQT